MRPENRRWCLVLVSALLLIPVVVGGTTYVVNPERTGDFPTIQAAIDSASDGDIIELADGTYTDDLGGGNRDVDYKGKAITIRSQSGNPDTCIVDPQSSASAAHQGFIFISGEGPHSRLEGIKVVGTDGYYTGSGGAIYTENSSPTITNCIFQDHTVGGNGGGASCHGGTPSFIDCCFEGNTCQSPNGPAGGGLCFRNCSPLVESCDFRSNTAYWSLAEPEAAQGGGIACLGVHYSGDPPRILNSDFISNVALPALPYQVSQGGGLYCESATIFNCRFLSNGARSGSGIYGNDITLTYCTIADNRADAEGLRCVSGNSTIINCTFSDNDWGAIFCANSSPAITNTIIAFERVAILCSGNASPTLTCCNVYGNLSGDWVDCIERQGMINGNMCADPLFCDAASLDFTLDSDSPCAWANNEECGYIGSLPVGCGETASVTHRGDAEEEAARIFPNPSKGPVKLDFEFPTFGWTSAQILDVSGRVVRNLFSGRCPGGYEGEFSLTWDGRDDDGRHVASGAYIVRLEGPRGGAIRRVVVAR